MSTTLKLDQLIAQAHEALGKHPEGTLPPIYRWQIYHHLDRNSVSISQCRGKLGVLATQRVIPVWQAVWPSDGFPQRILAIVEGVLQQTLDLESARQEAERAWQHIEVMGAAGEGLEHEQALYVGEAAVETLLEALGKDPFEGVDMTNVFGDKDLDPWCSDVAMLAVTAYAGPEGQLGSDPDKRRGFWEWWLREVVPTTCQGSQ